MVVLLLCNIAMGPLRKRSLEKGLTLLVNLLKSRIFVIISPYEDFYKLGVNYTQRTKVQISPRESLLDFSELKKDFLKVLASAHFKYLIQNLTNMSLKRVFLSLASRSLRMFHATLPAKLKYLENNGLKRSFFVNIQQME